MNLHFSLLENGTLVMLLFYERIYKILVLVSRGRFLILTPGAKCDPWGEIGTRG
jgi:hypothetical protein